MENDEISEFKVVIRRKEIPPSYSDRTGHLSAWGLSKMLHDGVVLLGKPYVGIPDQKTTLAVILREKRCVNADNLRAVSFNRNRIYSTTIKEIVFAGKTSFTIRNKVYLEDSPKPIFESYVKSVFIDAVSRRPIKLPMIFDTLVNTDQDPLGPRQKMQSVPEAHFKDTVEVQHGSLDHNGHVTNSEYTRFMIDCATKASLSGFFKIFTLDMCWYPLLEMETTFLGERFAKDLLEIICWQDSISLQTIYCSISSREKLVIEAVCKFQTTPYCDIHGSKL